MVPGRGAEAIHNRIGRRCRIRVPGNANCTPWKDVPVLRGSPDAKTDGQGSKAGQHKTHDWTVKNIVQASIANISHVRGNRRKVFLVVTAGGNAEENLLVHLAERVVQLVFFHSQFHGSAVLLLLCWVFGLVVVNCR